MKNKEQRKSVITSRVFLPWRSLHPARAVTRCASLSCDGLLNSVTCSSLRRCRFPCRAFFLLVGSHDCLSAPPSLDAPSPPQPSEQQVSQFKSNSRTAGAPKVVDDHSGSRVHGVLPAQLNSPRLMPGTGARRNPHYSKDANAAAATQSGVAVPPWCPTFQYLHPDAHNPVDISAPKEKHLRTDKAYVPDVVHHHQHSHNEKLMLGSHSPLAPEKVNGKAVHPLKHEHHVTNPGLLPDRHDIHPPDAKNKGLFHPDNAVAFSESEPPGTKCGREAALLAVNPGGAGGHAGGGTSNLILRGGGGKGTGMIASNTQRLEHPPAVARPEARKARAHDSHALIDAAPKLPFARIVHHHHPVEAAAVSSSQAPTGDLSKSFHYEAAPRVRGERNASKHAYDILGQRPEPCVKDNFQDTTQDNAYLAGQLKDGSLTDRRGLGMINRKPLREHAVLFQNNIFAVAPMDSRSTLTAAEAAMSASGMMNYSPGLGGSLKAPFKTDRTTDKRRFAKSSQQLGPQQAVYAAKKAGVVSSTPRRR